MVISHLFFPHDAKSPQNTFAPFAINTWAYFFSGKTPLDVLLPPFFSLHKLQKVTTEKKAVLLINRTNVGWFFLFQRTSGPGFDT
jgi:hypothetical protein